MRQKERHDAITEMVMNAGSMRIEELAQAFDVSLMTIHRDLDALAGAGGLRKTRGVVTADSSALFEANSEYRERQGRAEKTALAEAAFALVEHGQGVILDDSTTGLPLVDLLGRRRPLTVITNYQRAMTKLSGQEGVTLISLGGQYYRWCDSYMGSVTIDAMRALRADILFCSTSAVIDDVCYHQHHDTVLVKRAMFDAAVRRVLYLDHSKFTRRALHAYLPVSAFDTVIVDSGTDAERIDHLQGLGVELIVAPVGAGRASD